MLYTVGYVLLAFAFILWLLIRIPSDMPKNIPSVPIYVSLLGLWSDMGQDEIYDRWLRKPLEQYGAVKIFFAGRWNVLVTRPEFLTNMFRNEDLYAKAGSQKKIPWSVIATLVGDNIINSHGDDWKLYTSVLKPGIQKQDFKIEPIIDKTRTFVSMLLSQQKELGPTSGIMVNGLIQRWAISIMGESFLDIDFGCLEKANQRIEVLQTIIKRTLFHPLYFNFPLLDKFPWLFRSRKTAFAIMNEFEDLLVDLVKNRPRKNKKLDPAAEKGTQDGDLVVHLLERALEEGVINDTQFRANLKIVFLTAHENAQQLLNSCFWELGMNQTVQSRLREEVLATHVENPTAEILNEMPYLNAVLYEMLRLYPPVSQLINRVTVAPAVLANQIKIPQRTWVGWNAYGVQIDPNVWGEDSRVFVPERWGTGIKEIQAKYRKEQVKGNYIPFNAHTRRCLGSGFALLEMRVVLFELVRRTKWTVDPTYKFKLTSGGILAPLRCKVIFEDLKSTAPAL
ncbi:putative sporulation-specific N-formyltyrosine oxidase Dit2 [Xylogone sp. PMI_703]|nr:putative sporulation-specific N-formyltyrosine oxidase Dit2 [Xylogone sp. PMI_703]